MPLKLKSDIYKVEFRSSRTLLVAFEIVPFALNTTICTIKKIIE